MDDKNQLKVVGLMVLWAAMMIAIAAAQQVLKIHMAWMLLPTILLGLCMIYVRQDTMDEFERAGLRWARAWGSISAVAVILGLYFALLLAPEQMAPIKGFFVHTEKRAFENGLKTAFMIIISCWAGAHLVWWFRHK